jgi:hypothetical protein
MSSNIISALEKYFEENENYTRKELLEFSKKIYDENYKKKLNAYQLFMKEQRVILNNREGEKKKSTELMKEIAELWKQQKPHNGKAPRTFFQKK